MGKSNKYSLVICNTSYTNLSYIEVKKHIGDFFLNNLGFDYQLSRNQIHNLINYQSITQKKRGVNPILSKMIAIVEI